ncbi:MAG: hypothetical protein HOW73_20585 [Polyangiaceae bacterium]|nr:hypothetical protein [Polyangiaceae bacterium]
MAKFNAVLKGTRAREPVTFTTLTGQEIGCDLRILVGEDFDHILADAAKRTKELGGEADENDPQYGYQIDVFTAARACTDPESPLDKPEPFFASAAELRENLDPDRIRLIAAQHRVFQDRVAPRPAGLSAEDFMRVIIELDSTGEGEDHPFVTWRPRVQLSFVRILAKQWLSSLTPKSPPGTSEDAPH